MILGSRFFFGILYISLPKKWWSGVNLWHGHNIFDLSQACPWKWKMSRKMSLHTMIRVSRWWRWEMESHFKISVWFLPNWIVSNHHSESQVANAGQSFVLALADAREPRWKSPSDAPTVLPLQVLTHLSSLRPPPTGQRVRSKEQNEFGVIFN